MNRKEKILITGAEGQIGASLMKSLRETYGTANVIASDIRIPEEGWDEPFEQLDVLDSKKLYEAIHKYQITQIYHLAAVLSAKGEEKPLNAWNLNMNSLLNVLEIARESNISRVFWPSSIAVFGKHAPRQETPQYTAMDPNTVYGISKIAGENWCAYYHGKYGLDVRSLRYPGLIGYDSLPGGGTTDYAVDIFYKALGKKEFTCYLSENTYLPMMYMPDAIRATMELMDAPESRLSVHSSYNIAGMSFAPNELATELKKYFPSFSMLYKPDYRQKIADSWPESINDQEAQQDWGWKPEYDLSAMTADMLLNLKKRKKESVF